MGILADQVVHVIGVDTHRDSHMTGLPARPTALRCISQSRTSPVPTIAC
jgi:hypothetical protein